MKTSVILVAMIFWFATISCESKKSDLPCCSDYATFTNDTIEVNKKIGQIIYLDTFEKYAIQVSDNPRIIYIPCQSKSIPSYLHSIIEFSGVIDKSSFEKDSITFYCIQISYVSIGFN